MAESTAPPARARKQPRQAKSIRAEAQFREQCAARNWTILGLYVNARTPIVMICDKGHECTPLPTNVMRGRGACRTCAGHDPKATEARLRALAAERDWTITGTYIDVDTPLAVICERGHEWAPLPHHVLRGHGCLPCSGNDPREAEARLRVLAAERGWIITGTYVNAATPIAMICEHGHECAPWPTSVLSGNGSCRTCAGKQWDVFYVVRNGEADEVKFGITSGDPRPRLGRHARAGYREVIRLRTGLPDTVAPDLERDLLTALHGAGERPIAGREYFPGRALAAVLAFVDGRLTVPRPRAEQVPLW
ncbi:hypothetical protein ACFY0A_37380 [Streptomyces sp. NPDC001698]|uniref:hypothetical protein n=1 Tax=Streptomyces sp. NPDC001698 TaxID=3364601 RepID=UPI003680ACB0